MKKLFISLVTILVGISGCKTQQSKIILLPKLSVVDSSVKRGNRMMNSKIACYLIQGSCRNIEKSNEFKEIVNKNQFEAKSFINYSSIFFQETDELNEKVIDDMPPNFTFKLLDYTNPCITYMWYEGRFLSAVK